MEEILDSIRRIIADDDPVHGDLLHDDPVHDGSARHDPADAEPAFSRPRPMAPARRPVAGYGQRPAASPADRRGAGPQRLYGRAPDGAASFAADEPGSVPHAPPPQVRPMMPPRRERPSVPDHGEACAPEVHGPEIGLPPRADARMNAGADVGPPPGLPRNASSPGAGAPAERPAWEADAASETGFARDARRREAGPAVFDRPPESGEDRRAAVSRDGEAPRASGVAPRPVSDLPPVRAPLAAESEPVAAPPVAASPAAEAPPAEAAGRREEATASNRPAPAAAIGERRAALPRKDLLSPAVDAAVAAAFRSLGDLVLPQQERTVEDLVKEILRPMLKEWLDQNLTGIVERLVRAEIERVTHTLR